MPDPTRDQVSEVLQVTYVNYPSDRFGVFDAMADAVLALLAEDPQPEPKSRVLGALASLRFGVDVPADLRDVAYEQVRAFIEAEAPQPKVLTAIEEEIATSAGVRITEEDVSDLDQVLMTGLLMIIDRLAPSVIEDTETPA
jgi:hypothetical protein